jgi:glycosyltransferase involved in cell wall biosynthesis
MSGASKKQFERGVLVCSDFGNVKGGLDRVAVDSAIGLAHHGFCVYYLCAVGPVDPELIAEKQIKVVCLGMKDLRSDTNRVRAAMNGLWNRRAHRAVADACRELTSHCDEVTVHVHSYTKALSCSIISAAKRWNLPVVLTLHDYFAFSPNGLHFDFKKGDVLPGNPLSVRNLIHNSDRRSHLEHGYRSLRAGLQKFSGLIPGNIDRFIAPSQVCADFAGQFLPNEKITVVRYPLRVTRRDPTDVTFNRRILFVGRLVAEKGALDLARAAKECGAELEYVGGGDLEPEVLEIYPQAKITGWLNAANVADRMAHSRCLVLPSLWYETFGLVVAEAMAIGLPVIVSDRVGAKEIVEHGKNGLIWKSMQIPELVEHLSRISNDVSFAQRAGKAAYERLWAEDFSLQRHVRQLADIYSTFKNRRAT